MSFVPINFDDVAEPKPAPAGKYNLQIAKCDVTETGPNSKNPGSPQLKVSIGFPEEPNTPNLSHYVSIPNGSDSDDFKALLLKRFLVLFNVPFDSNGIDLENISMEMVGASAHAEVAMSEPNDNGDVYNRLVLPRLPNEPGRR